MSSSGYVTLCRGEEPGLVELRQHEVRSASLGPLVAQRALCDLTRYRKPYISRSGAPCSEQRPNREENVNAAQIRADSTRRMFFELFEQQPTVLLECFAIFDVHSSQHCPALARGDAAH
jgi:hypothetical protein